METSSSTENDSKLAQLEERIKYLELVAEKSGMAKKAKLTLAFESLDEDLKQFAQDFTITMNSYFIAYRGISTGLVKAVQDDSALETLKNWVFKILGFVPVIGDYIGIIDDIVSLIFEKWKEQNLQERTRRVMNIVKALMTWDEDELTNAVAWTAIQLCIWYDFKLYGVDGKKAAAVIIGYLISYEKGYEGFRENVEMTFHTYSGFSLSCINALWIGKKQGLIVLNNKMKNE